MQLFIIDAIGPFFKKYTRETINWSKIPFSHLEDDDGLDMSKFKKIRQEFKHFIDIVAELGYNAISIDDLAHLVSFDFYPEEMASLIRQYQSAYDTLFKYARKKGLQIFITTDVMFFNRWIDARTAKRPGKINELLHIAIEKLFHQFDVQGLILRIGESDGVDVKGTFKSRLTVRTPRQVNKLIKQLLPVFEKRQKQMIFRTWTVGIYPIGDLIWNERTFARTFADINSDFFIVSMKFGDTDFYDDLELSPLFAIGPHKKIVELQARREREGFGELPYYVGWQYEKYYKQLSELENMVGVSVWCQSGGWSTWRNRTFLRESSMWNELNTRAIIDIYKHGMTADESLQKAAKKEERIAFIREAYELIHDILYIKELSDQPVYFRRLRIPPLIWLYWDHVVLNPLLIALLEYMGVSKYKMPKNQLANFHKKGKKLGIRNIDYMHDTLMILARCRRIMWKNSIKPKHVEHIENYKRRYDMPLKFSIHIAQTNYSKARLAFKIFLRRRPQYRFIDRILLSFLVSAAFRFVYRLLNKNLPSFVNKQAMRVDMLFK